MSPVEPPIITRFAPSPTGLLHLGHAYAALKARHSTDCVENFYLRLDDLDQTRSKALYETYLLEDLAWLGLSWNPNIRKQSEHFSQYREALKSLQERGLVYPCFCTRKEILEETSRAGNAPHGPSGAIYPGTCRHRSKDQIETWIQEEKDFSLRLDIEKAWYLAGTELTWVDLNHGKFIADPRSLGDVVIARKDSSTSYHLAVVIDDHEQGVTLVTRGSDLLHATPLHRVLQELLNLKVPTWQHHSLVTDENGVRLAKSAYALSLRSLKAKGWTAEQVLEYLVQHTNDSSILA